MRVEFRYGPIDNIIEDNMSLTDVIELRGQIALAGLRVPKVGQTFYSLNLEYELDQHNEYLIAVFTPAYDTAVDPASDPDNPINNPGDREIGGI